LEIIMKRIVLTLALSSACLSNAQPYVVSATGNDVNPGTLEKPFATLQRAQQAVRQKRGDVCLRGGTYYLTPPVVTASDSGTKDDQEESSVAISVPVR
jgi:hypothetical protein